MKGDIIALLAGALLCLAFAPFFIFPLAIIAPAILLSLWLNVSKIRAFWRGFLFGLGFFGAGVHWVFISIHTYGYASIGLSAVITLGFVMILALFPAFNGYLFKRYFHASTLAFPALWVSLEWVRSWIFTGFPWLLLGESQIYSPLKGYAPLFSVYGVSLAATMSSMLLVKIFLHKNIKNTLLNGFYILMIWTVGGCLSLIHWTQPKGVPIQISLIQGNIAQDIKWSYDQVIPTLKRYATLTRDNWKSKIIIWPESAIPLSLQDAQPFIEKMDEEAKEHNNTIITGIPIQKENTDFYYNGILAFGQDYGFYLKRRLVPFGEYTPFPHLLSHWLARFQIPMSNLIPGKNASETLNVQGLKIAAFICYEIAYPNLVWQKDNIDMLLTVSNDAWFGHSIAQAQHLALAQIRALELGRPVLFVSNNGITAIIKPNGRIQSSIPPFEEAVLTDFVQATTGNTPWQKYGEDPIFVITISLLLLARRAHKKYGNTIQP